MFKIYLCCCHIPTFESKRLNGFVQISKPSTSHRMRTVVVLKVFFFVPLKSPRRLSCIPFVTQRQVRFSNSTHARVYKTSLHIHSVLTYTFSTLDEDTAQPAPECTYVNNLGFNLSFVLFLKLLVAVVCRLAVVYSQKAHHSYKPINSTCVVTNPAQCCPLLSYL